MDNNHTVTDLHKPENPLNELLKQGGSTVAGTNHRSRSSSLARTTLSTPSQWEAGRSS